MIKLSIAKRNLNSDNDAAGKPGPRLERSVGLRQLSLVKHDIKRDNSNQIMPAGLGKAHLRLKLSVTKRNITGHKGSQSVRAGSLHFTTVCGKTCTPAWKKRRKNGGFGRQLACGPRENGAVKKQTQPVCGRTKP